MYTQNQLAFTAPAVPCNPLPFLSELIEKIKTEGADFIQTDNGKMLLLTLNIQAYGQFGDNAIADEFGRLWRLAKIK